jgi:hypothetical protein
MFGGLILVLVSLHRFGGKDAFKLFSNKVGHIGLVVQSVRMPPCHGGGRGFESRPVRRFFGLALIIVYIQEAVAQCATASCRYI